jgi:hypothetical protein
VRERERERQSQRETEREREREKTERERILGDLGCTILSSPLRHIVKHLKEEAKTLQAILVPLHFNIT